MNKIFTVPLKGGGLYVVRHTPKGKFYLKRGATYKESDAGNIKRVIERQPKQPILKPSKELLK